ncbi:alpha-hydroxy-acid oxidizing protein [Crossiella sp. SN42]|uniref:alpha-hydroxy-acid oxidizing protein n=1 Tax=Crossiella sp. SN42 TaxID=2944808 RepID=UPI00207D61D4|nr:alpha-hydroxy-acid oxidizing protein [Crossiella sp. SN42]MCO1575568.1 alpha-hydroxy-acid oxidizing protein [Crossiella sp. SN42]
MASEQNGPHRSWDPTDRRGSWAGDDQRNPLRAQHTHLMEGGRRGKVPFWPTGLDEFQALVEATLSQDERGRNVLAYLCGTAGAGRTAAANRRAFHDHAIIPDVLAGADIRDHQITVLGTPMAAPLMLAPIGGLDMAHPSADVHIAEAAADLGLPWILSPAASVTPEDIQQLVPQGRDRRWFELLFSASDQLNTSLLTRAEKAGFEVLVVNVDTALPGWRPRTLDAAAWPFDRGCGAAAYRSDPHFQALVEDPDDPASVGRAFARLSTDSSRTWHDLTLLRRRWPGRLAVKGILTARDTRNALDCGADCVIVSNHGGRQLDGTLSTLEALPAVVHAARDVPVLLDGGIRSGLDMFIALALGAKAVLVGLPYALGVALDGYDGVHHVLANLLADYDHTMALAGVCSPSQLHPSRLHSRPRSPSLLTTPWPTATRDNPGLIQSRQPRGET